MRFLRGSLKCKTVNVPRKTQVDGQRLIAIGHLTDSGDLKNTTVKMLWATTPNFLKKNLST